jgi:hypothetical protein
MCDLAAIIVESVGEELNIPDDPVAFPQILIESDNGSIAAGIGKYPSIIVRIIFIFNAGIGKERRPGEPDAVLPFGY